jgi:hypothetical protein
MRDARGGVLRGLLVELDGDAAGGRPGFTTRPLVASWIVDVA